MITEKIDKIGKYFRELNSLDGYKCITVDFPTTWVVIGNENIACERMNAVSVVFYSNNNKITFDDIVDFITEIVEKNEEVQAKKMYLDLAIENLKKFFNEHSLKEIKKYDFNFQSVKKKKEVTKEKNSKINLVKSGTQMVSPENNEVYSNSNIDNNDIYGSNDLA